MLRYFLALPILATVKVNLQGYFSRGRTKTLSDVFSLNAMIFTALSVSMAALFLRGPFPAELILWGVASGLFSTLFQVSYTMAFRCGPVAPATIINNFNITLPLLVGVCLFGETVSVSGIIGLALLAVAFCLIPERSEGKVNARWMIFTVLAFLGSGANNALMVIFARSAIAEHKQAYIVIGYATAAVFCFVLSLLLHRRGEERFRPDGKLLLGVCVIGVVLGLYNLMLVHAAAEVAAVVLYPVVNGLTIFWIALSDRIIFRQKSTPMQLVGMLIGAAAVILLNL